MPGAPPSTTGQVLSEAGAVRNGVVDLARFQDIPFLTRDIVRDQFGRLTSRSLPEGRRAYRNATGGSTGQPAQFLQDNVYWDVNVATKLFHFEWFGKQPGDRELKIRGAEHDLLKGREGLGSRLKNWLYNRRSEQCFFLPEERVQAIIAHINRFRPDLIWSYRDGIDVIAQAINRQGLKMHRPRGRVPGRRHHLPAHRGGGGEGLRRPGDQHLWRPRDRRRRLPVPRAWRPARLPQLA